MRECVKRLCKPKSFREGHAAALRARGASLPCPPPRRECLSALRPHKAKTKRPRLFFSKSIFHARLRHLVSWLQDTHILCLRCKVTGCGQMPYVSPGYGKPRKVLILTRRCDFFWQLGVPWLSATLSASVCEPRTPSSKPERGTRIPLAQKERLKGSEVVRGPQPGHGDNVWCHLERRHLSQSLPQKLKTAYKTRKTKKYIYEKENKNKKKLENHRSISLVNLDTKINKEEIEMHPINIMTKQGIVQKLKNDRYYDICQRQKVTSDK